MTDSLAGALRAQFCGEGQPLISENGFAVSEALGETVLQAPAEGLDGTMRQLRDSAGLRFEQLIDIAGMDYSEHARLKDGPRFGAIYHLLSVSLNQRLRVRVFCADDSLPQLPSVCDVWPAADWFEREAFDLFGIVFHGHKDLRRILTDYGFVGHPFRKDFPISGHVEMRYDPAKKRVVYVPVSIAPREVTPRIVREESFAQGRDNKAD